MLVPLCSVIVAIRLSDTSWRHFAVPSRPHNDKQLRNSCQDDSVQAIYKQLVIVVMFLEEKLPKDEKEKIYVYIQKKRKKEERKMLYMSLLQISRLSLSLD